MTTEQSKVWVWLPLISVGPIEFGMNMAEVEALFPGDPKRTKRPCPLYREQYVDRWDWLSVFYNDKGLVDMVSISPCDECPEIRHIYWDKVIDVIHTPFEQLRSFLQEEAVVQLEDEGWTLTSAVGDYQFNGPLSWTAEEGTRISLHPGDYASSAVFYGKGVFRRLKRILDQKEYELMEMLIEAAEEAEGDLA